MNRTTKQCERDYIASVGATPYPNNERGRDGRYTDGTSFEFKCLLYSTPSIGGKYVTDYSHNIREAVGYYMSRAEWLVVEYEPRKYLKMSRVEAIEWLSARASLNRTSTAKGKHWTLRLNRNPRTAEATAKLLAEGFTL